MEYDGTGLEVAIIGMAGRFPGAPDIETFWRNLDGGVESIRFFSDEELLQAGVAPELVADPNYIKARGYLDGSEFFDAELFGFNPREAEILDPQQRLFLEVAWSALEHAGYGRGGERPAIGVYAGVSLNGYYLNNLLTRPEVLASVGTMQAGTGVDKDFLATRVSYKLDLQGPSVSVQTACSTSLVAVHLACQALLSGECEIALAGGASVGVPPVAGYLYQEGGILSPDGHCRAFDAESAGCVGGHGAGAVVLKRLDDALADGDTLYAVIKGSAINNDGALKAGYTAPSVDGQAAVIRAALRVAEVEADSIGLIEAHGTGTPIGDPIEITALRQAFGADGGKARSATCAVGSVKTNIGHLDAAAGIAGLIKAVLALQHRRIPANLHFRTPNPQLRLDASPFYIPTGSKEWPAPGTTPRRAGVSSFGIGGTNAHVVLEEAPAEVVPTASDRSETGERPWQLLCLSGQSEDAEAQVRRRLAAFLEHSEIPLADVAYTLQLGRRPLRQRTAVLARGGADAVAVLSGEIPERSSSARAPEGRASVAFLFPGQGAQYPGMARELYEREAVFRDQLDRCLDGLRAHMEEDLRRWLLPTATDQEQAAEALRRTELTQPALFAVEFALCELWHSWGVEPEAMLGHSIGEWLAACRSGVMTLEAVLEVVALRGRWIAECAPGAMLSVPLSEAQVTSRLAGRQQVLHLAAVNAPELCVIAGPGPEVDSLEAELRADGIEVRRLHTSHAFHTPALQPAAARLEAHLQRVDLRPPGLPFLSNVTGTWITREEATSPVYWASQLLHPVRFADGLDALCASGPRCLLEVGPGHTLSRLARQHPRLAPRPGVAPSATVLPSLPPPRSASTDDDASHDAQASTLLALGRLWTWGVEFDGSALYAGQTRRRRALPTYPFQHRRYWIEAGAASSIEEGKTSRLPLGRWFWRPAWQQAEPARRLVAPDDGRPPKLLLAGAAGATRDDVSRHLHALGWQVEATETVTSREAWLQRLRDLRQAGELPRRIVHLGAGGRRSASVEPTETHRTFFELLALAQALSELGVEEAKGESVEVLAVTSAAWSVTGDEASALEEVAALGPLRTLPHEVPGVRCRTVDVEDGVEPRHLAATLAEPLAEPLVEWGDDLLALRGRQRWRLALQQVELPASKLDIHDGIYLVTGGLGGLGRVFTQFLLQRGATVIVVSRSTREEERAALTQAASTADHLVVVQADVTDEDAMRRVFDTLSERFGRLDGVLHAAGVPGEGALARTSETEAGAVLAPKVTGTRILDTLLRQPSPSGRPWLHELDFFLLCGSLTSHLSGPGQVAYTAANLFLDAYAQRTALELQELDAPPAIVAVDWDAWREVGMAAAAARRVADRGTNEELSGEPLAGHPLLHRRQIDGEVVTFRSRLRAADTWILADHRTGGQSVMPGTGYLELLRAAFLHRRENGETASAIEGTAVEISRLTLLTPMAFGDGRRDLRVRLQPVRETTEAAWRAEVASRGLGESDWQLHAEARIAVLEGSATERALPVDGFPAADKATGGAENPFFEFGPRWTELEQTRISGADMDLSRLSLAGEHTSDLRHFDLHPALLDAAVAASPPDDAPYLPFAYDRVRVYRPLAASVLSRVTPRPTEGAGTAKFDIQVLDVEGRMLVEVEGYTLRRLNPEAAAALQATGLGGAQADGLRDAIRNAEGVEVLERVLASRLPQVLVSTVDFEIRRRQLLHANRETNQPGAAATHARPTLSTPYAAPSTEIEHVIAEVWSELLGVDEIGIHDDFFELGGHSILATQGASRLRERLGTNMPLDEFFEANTIAQLARRITDFEATSGAGTESIAALSDIEEGAL